MAVSHEWEFEMPTTTPGPAITSQAKQYKVVTLRGDGGGVGHEWVVKFNLDGLEYHTIIFTFLHKRVEKGNTLDITNDDYAKLTTDNDRERFARDYIGLIGKLPSGLLRGMKKFCLSQYIKSMGWWLNGEIRIKTNQRTNKWTLFHELGHDVNGGLDAYGAADLKRGDNYEYFIAAYKDNTHITVYSQSSTNEHHSEAFTLWCIVQIFIAVYSTSLDKTILDSDLTVMTLIKCAILSKNKILHFDKQRFLNTRYPDKSNYVIDFFNNTNPPTPDFPSTSCNSIDRLIYITRNNDTIQTAINTWQKDPLFTDMNQKSDIWDTLYDGEVPDTLESICSIPLKKPS